MKKGKIPLRPRRVSNMAIMGSGGKTICNVLREIYNLTDDREIGRWCRVAMDMAQRMDARLKWYKRRHGDM